MNPLAIFFTGIFLTVVIYRLFLSSKNNNNTVQENFKNHLSLFKRPKDLKTAENVTNSVNKFYDLVSNIFEWSWGPSFHISPFVKGKSHVESTRLHEEMVSKLLKAEPGQVILDVGCGVGGPMRTIANHSGAKVIGITNNDHQVIRGGELNKKAGLDKLCEIVNGDFLEIPFGDNSFDAVYSISATCHAPKLEEVYAEILRVMKPGARYVSYDWATTDKFDEKNQEHVEIIEKIERGNAIPGMRSYKEIEESATKVGFNVMYQKDLAVDESDRTEAWWKHNKYSSLAYWRDYIVIQVLLLLGLVSKGTIEIHAMLFNTNYNMCRGGQLGIYTPMHMILCYKKNICDGN